MEYELNYERKFDREGQKFTAQFQYRDNSETEAADYLATSYDANRNRTEDPSVSQRSRNAENQGNVLIQADYVYPYSKDRKIELVVKQHSEILAIITGSKSCQIMAGLTG
ncbi:MAG: outer membrane beta-barrel protein [Saprospiraceae bacterium]|nr:outer membrane beta-barrel protein [Saprospiraceae bacterium]